MAHPISHETLKSLTDPDSVFQTILVLGGSYGGFQAANTLIEGLVASEKNDGKVWRVIIVDRNSHFNREQACCMSFYAC